MGFFKNLKLGFFKTFLNNLNCEPKDTKDDLVKDS